MSTKIFIRLLAVALFTHSCNVTNYENTSDSYSSVPFDRSEIKSLTGFPVGPTDYFFDPQQLKVLGDSILMVVDGQRDKLLHFYNFKSQSVTAFGNKGNGPYEMDESNAYPPFFVNDETRTIDIFEPNKRRFASYAIDSLLSGTNTYFPKYITSPPEVGTPNSMIQVSGNEYIINSALPCSRLAKWNITTDEITCSDDLIDINYDLSGDQRSSVSYEVISIKPDGKYLVSTMFHFNRIDIFNRDMSHHLTIGGAQKRNPYDFCENQQGKTVCNWDKIQYYSDPAFYVTDNHIYRSFARPLKKEVSSIFDTETVLDVFDWEGNFKGSYALGMFTYSFAVDESRGKIFAINHLVEDQVISEYPLPDLSTYNR